MAVETTTEARQSGRGARAQSADAAGLMHPGFVLALVLIGVFAFGAFLTLMGYSQDFQGPNRDKAHAKSVSAIGYGALAEVLAGQGFTVDYDATPHKDIFETKFDANARVLKIVTLNRPVEAGGFDTIDMSAPLLLVLPKWQTRALPGRADWVQRVGAPYLPYRLERTIKPFVEDVKISRAVEDKTARYDLTGLTPGLPQLAAANINRLQSLSGEALVPLIKADDKIILAQIEGKNTYILSEPDILNTQGLSDRQRTRFASKIMRYLTTQDGLVSRSVSFDLTLHGFGASINVIKTLTQPPFLGATLCLIAVGFLIAWQAFSRFGDPIRTRSDTALGKTILVSNAARLIRIGRREHKMARGYIDLTRRRAAKALKLGGRSRDDIDAALHDRSQSKGTTTLWPDLVLRANQADTPGTVLHAARALYEWKQEITDDRH